MVGWERLRLCVGVIENRVPQPCGRTSSSGRGDHFGRDVNTDDASFDRRTGRIARGLPRAAADVQHMVDRANLHGS
jgi:hypothetical protein